MSMKPFTRRPDSAKSYPVSVTKHFSEIPQPEFEINFYLKVYQANPQNSDILRCLAELFSRKGQPHEALKFESELVKQLS